MKRYKFHIILLLFIAICLSASAQKRKKVIQKKAPVATNEETPAQKLFKSMLHSTAKVMFIDSVVVNKSDFISHIPLNKESGSIIPYNQFFNKQEQPTSAVYKNEFGDRCYYAKQDTTYGNQIYTMDKTGGKWASPQPAEGIGDEFKNQDNPFLMPDGITLFFAAKGDNSIGGYDIFMTLFDGDTDKFYKPENYGLPYNSTANDYLIAYDDLDTLGWLVSDRYQPEGKVCIYTFVPTYPRIGFDHDTLTDSQLTNYARLTSIKDTWKFGDRDKAMERLHKMMQRATQKQDDNMISFVVNDNITYTSLDDFRSPTNRESYLQLLDMKKILNKNEQKLENDRNEYHQATSHLQREMKDPILREEKEIEQQRAEIQMAEKKIRNAENLLHK